MDYVVSCSDFLFGLLDMCFIQRSVQCDAKIHRGHDTFQSLLLLDDQL